MTYSQDYGGQPMHDVEEKIARWRESMARGGVGTPAVLDELESHLRDHIDQQVRAGCEPSQAFNSGIERIGAAGALRGEFMRSQRPATLTNLLGLLENRRTCYLISMIAAGVMSLGYFKWKASVTPVYAAEAVIQLLQRASPISHSPSAIAINDVQSADRLNRVLRYLGSQRLQEEVRASLTAADVKTLRKDPTRSRANHPVTIQEMGTLKTIPHRLSLLVSASVFHEHAEAAALLANRYAELCWAEFNTSENAGKFMLRSTPAVAPRLPTEPNLSRILRTSIIVAVLSFASLVLLASALRKWLPLMQSTNGPQVSTS